MLHTTFVVILAIIAMFGGCAAGVFAVLHSIRDHKTDGILYVEDIDLETPAIYTTLNKDISEYKNGQFMLLLVRRVKNNRPQK